jgi:hypothetical protein
MLFLLHGQDMPNGCEMLHDDDVRAETISIYALKASRALQRATEAEMLFRHEGTELEFAILVSGYESAYEQGSVRVHTITSPLCFVPRESWCPAAKRKKS